MGLDIRLPIGLMFTLLGALLGGYGFFTLGAGDGYPDIVPGTNIVRPVTSFYQSSLGIDINLWWGLVLLIFGLAMLIPALLSRRNSNKE